VDTTERAFKRDFAALEDVFVFIGEFIEGRDLDASVAYAINLAVEEIFTNMVKYNKGSGDTIRIAIGGGDDAVTLQLADFDVEPFHPDSAPDPDISAPIDARTPGGLGLHLVKSVVDKLTYEYNDRQMKVTVVKRLEP